MSERVYVRYQDDGPSGPCGQTMNVTSPWDRLYVYENEEDARAFVRFVKDKRVGWGRRNPRISGYWSWADGNAYEGVRPVASDDPDRPS